MPEYLEEIKFYQISTEINEELHKYTYDYQKKYTGTYDFNSYSLLGIKKDKNDYRYGLEKDHSYIINIDDNGYLFFENGLGNETWKGKIIDENKQTMLFGIVPGGAVMIDENIRWEGIKIYYSQNIIFYENCYKNYLIDEEEPVYYTIQFTYKRK